MLTNLKLTNFRKVRSDEMTFAPGVNVVRGVNEASKTSRLEAVAYTLFGSSALRTPLDEVVTRGEPVNSLKAELTMQVDGVTLVFKRGKSGAEVLKNGEVFCTGQKEVSTFAASLFGADANVAAKLFMANQNGLRGALEEGPKALSVLLEQLADISAFDRILDAAQAKLILGNPALLEERLKGAKATLEAATQNMPERFDDAACDARIEELNKVIAENEAKVPDLRVKADAAKVAHQNAAVVFTKKDRLLTTLKQKRDAVEAATRQVVELTPAANVIVTDSRPALTAELAQARDFERRRIAYRIFRNLPDGERADAATWQREMDETNNALRTAAASVVAIEKKLISVKARRINHDKCDKCGQDVTHLATVIETNAKVDAEVATLTSELATRNAEVTRLTPIMAKFEALVRFGRTFSAELAKLGEFVVLDESVYPPRATWNTNYPVPETAPDVAALEAALRKVEGAVAALDRARAQLDLAKKNLVKAEADAEVAQRECDAVENVSIEDVLRLEAEKNDAEVACLAARGFAIEARNEIASLNATRNTAAQLWNAAKARVDDAQRTIDECERDLGDIGFNNALVKKLRAMRPMVADQLWNTVLASVSVMFTQMRGETSIVTKGKDGFRVNDQAVESLSGSTLDLLGLALRTALAKTFIPHCGLLVLDEPCASMDQSRTAALLGFVSATGFEQTIIVTHELLSDSIADNIIEI